MKIRNIKWDIDIDDVLETIDEMTVEKAAEVLGFPKDTYANINTLERDIKLNLQCIYHYVIFVCFA